VVAVRSARNSANLTASTLQEDLMRLIGPDREEAASEQGSHQDSPLSRLPRKTLSELSLMKSRSRENIAGSALGGGGGGSELAGEENLSFHMARPATVISGSSLASSTNSPPSTAAATSVGGGGREDEVQMLLLQQQRGASPHVSSVSIGVVNNNSNSSRSGRNSSSSGGQASPVVVLATAAATAVATSSSHARTNNKEPGGGGNSMDKDMDWNSLVDTATKAILSGSEETSAEGGGGAQRRPRSALLEGEEVRRLLERVSSLEVELAGERAGREQLGRQVDQLREENVRLQEESQTAAQQLRRFTEWFFQTIDKS
jgi:signal-induced proliferation-associated 1 like protein 1